MFSPVLHEYVLPGATDKSTEPPAQKRNGPDAVIDAAGNGSTVTIVAAEVEEQPFALMTLTV